MAGEQGAAQVIASIAVLLVVVACKTLATEPLVPALIVDPSAESRAELLRTVSEALGGAPVTLADDALTLDSLLIIERRRQRDLQDRPLTGRELGKPEHFRLMTNGSDCLLVHLADERRWVLEETRCVAE